jgi:superfamily II DNA or RNA helicase/HKD family nuclease
MEDDKNFGATGSLIQPPILVLNQPLKNKRVLTKIQHELAACQEFWFYVAFVNQEGVVSLLQTLEELRLRNVKGKVLVSQYLNFTDPVALRTLIKLANLDVRISTKGSMHSKGYRFKIDHQLERYIVGSSNWTASALSTNTELNILLESRVGVGIAEEFGDEFEFQFSKAEPVTADFIDLYEKKRRDLKFKSRSLQNESSRLDRSVDPDLEIDKMVGTLRSLDFPQDSSQDLSAGNTQTECDRSVTESDDSEPRQEWVPPFGPNSMQVDALLSINKLRTSGENKALIVSATGTGKTLLSAFDAQAFGARRLLFVVHRENIARTAMSSFRRVFGSTRSFGLYTGSIREKDADFVFCTVQTISRPDHLNQFSRNHFDYIIVDESHRTSALSYVKFLNHFTPRFLLGMTATPERTDGADIFRFFDYNIAYEIRLQRALEEKMLCPFHYFGVTDLTVNGKLVDEHADFGLLTSEERVSRILEKSELYGCYDGVLRGLIFCSRIEESKALSLEFNKRGYRTISLDGSNCDSDREQAIRRLEADLDSHEKLDYILTVDIFNEGVDIPQCNQIILLRPTQSAIIFVQQIGRGLRRVEGTDKFLIVIDFIGNYKNNFLIPVALFGDRTFDKDKIRRLLVAGNEGLPGCSTINFDRVARERIFASIDNAKTQHLKDLKADFLGLQARLGRQPMMVDFIEHDFRDPSGFVDYSKSFYSFARIISGDDGGEIQPNFVRILEVYSRDALNGKTIEEGLLLRGILAQSSLAVEDLNKEVLKITGDNPPFSRWESAARSIDLRFIRESVGGSLVPVGQELGLSLVEIDSQTVRRRHDFRRLIDDKVVFKYLSDLVEYSISKFLLDFNVSDYRDGFVRYRKYGRSDVFRILGAKENPVAQNVGGYKIDPEAGAWCPIFVTYKKHEKISATTQYEDEFIDQRTLRYFSKNRRTLRSPDVEFFRSAPACKMLPLFVKKNDGEGIEFYYIGNLTPDRDSFRQQSMPDADGGSVSVVTMTMHLDKTVDDAFYKYLIL